MRLVDCHVHLQEPAIRRDIGRVLAEARSAGVVRWFCNGSTEADWPVVAQLARDHEGIVPCFGLHPWYIGERSVRWMQTLEHLLDELPGACVGEIGIDRWIEPRDEAGQDDVFRAQLDIAAQKNRPVMIHCLRGWGWLMDVLRSRKAVAPAMLIHAYGGSVELIKPLAEMGAYFSFAGNIFEPKRETAREAVKAVPLDRLLIETDAPDMLPPTGHRTHDLELDGKPQNHPANLRVILRGIAQLRDMDEETLAGVIWQNAARVVPVGAAFATSGRLAYSTRMPFQLTTTREFAAAHQLRLYDGSLEPLHGHNWRVKATVAAERLDPIGVVMDFHELERLVDAIIAPWHNHHLNEAGAFAELNPSTENVALVIGRTLKLPEGVWLLSVEVWETPANSAIYLSH